MDTQPIDLNQLELHEITRETMEGEIPAGQMSGREFRSVTALAKSEPPKLKHFLEAVEAVYKAKADDIADERAAKTPLPEEAGSETLHANHCFGLFRPGFTRPEIVVYVSLQNTKAMEGDALHPERLPGNIQALRSNAVPHVQAPDTMVFYSISSAPSRPDTKGLANELIGRLAKAVSGKQAEEAVPEMASINTFTTLSPVPGFNRWLANLFHESLKTPGLDLLTPHEKSVIGKCFTLEFDDLDGEKVPFLTKGWRAVPETEKGQAQKVIKSLCLRYLLSMDTARDPRDPGADPLSIVAPPLQMVPGMHAKGNGAYLAEIHPMVDPSDLSVGDLGTKVNYVYDLERLRENQVFCGKYHIPVSPLLEGIAEGWHIPLNSVTAPKRIPALSKNGDNTPTQHGPR